MTRDTPGWGGGGDGQNQNGYAYEQFVINYTLILINSVYIKECLVEKEYFNYISFVFGSLVLL